MKKYKNTLLSLLFFIAAPASLFLWPVFGKLFIANPSQLAFHIPDGLFIWPYLILFAMGIFFGWKNFKSKESLLIGNIITLVGILVLSYFAFIFIVAMGWRG